MTGISSLLPFSPAGSSQALDPVSLLEQAAAARQAQKAAETQQGSALQANQAKVTGLNQLLSAANAFDATLHIVEQQGPADAVNGARQFVDAYNKLLATVSALAGAGGVLANDPIVDEIRNTLNAALGGVASNLSGGLSAIGITQNSDGSLSLDTAALQQAEAADPAGTAAALTRAADALDSAGARFSQPDGAIAAEANALESQQTVLAADAAGSGQSKAQAQQAISDYLALAEAEMHSQLLAGFTDQLLGAAGAAGGGASASLATLLGQSAGGASDGGAASTTPASIVSLLT